MPNTENTLVTIATYNEIENLPRLVEAIFAVAPDVHLLVVDDNSPDGTGRWCDERAARDPRVRVVHREGKLGLGTATIAAMRYAIEHDYKQMLNMDADFSHDPRYVPAILEAMREGEHDAARRVDVVIGSRYTAGGGVENWPLKRRLMSRGVNTYARWLLGLSVRDCSGAFRCYRVNVLREIRWGDVISRGYSFQEEILYRLRRAGARMVEVPIRFADRRFGNSKIDSREAVAALAILLRLGLSNWLRLPEPKKRG